jgi:hypothetical protein
VAQKGEPGSQLVRVALRGGPAAIDLNFFRSAGGACAIVMAVAIVSRNQAITFAGLFFSIVCALIYAAHVYHEPAHAEMPFVKYGSVISEALTAVFAICYAIERFARHYIEREPFLEF